MDVKLEKTDNVNGVITVDVVEADYADKVKKELKRIGDTHPMPGFRKGHVPMDALRRRFGRDVKSDVLNNMVFDEVIKYIRDNNIQILGEPLPVELKEIKMDDPDYSFSYRIGIMPDFQVEADKSVKIPFYTIEVTDKMREEQDQMLRRRLGSQVPGPEYEDNALVKGVLMQLNDDGTVNEAEGAIQVINGIVAPSYFKDKDEAAKFNGAHVDDKVVFNPWKSCEGNAAELSSMLNIDKEIAVDVKNDFQLTISEIIVLRPAEHDQDFFDNVFGKDKVHNEEEYTTALTNMIANNFAGSSRNLFADSVQDYYVKKYKDIELPEEFLKDWLVARNEELTAENIQEEFTKMRDSLVWQLVKGQLVDKLGVKVEEADMLAQAKMIAYQQFAQYGITNLDDDTITEHAKNILSNKEYRQRIHENVGDNKLYFELEKVITVDNQTVDLERFKQIAESMKEA